MDRRLSGKHGNAAPRRGLLLAALSLAAAPLAAGPEPAPPAVRFSLDVAEGRPGDVVALRLSVFTEAELRSISVALNFDASYLRAQNLIRLAEAMPAPPAADVLEVRIDNQDEAADPADSSRNGWISLQLSVGDREAPPLPVAAAGAIFEIQFLILRGPQAEPARAFFTPVVFEDVGVAMDGGAVQQNQVEVQVDADNFEARVLDAADLDDGGVVILGIGEIGFFRRADANHDCNIDISDSLFTLGSLFLSGGPPPCADAADANDDGTMDVSDAVFTLRWLFTSGPAPPYPLDYGSDPTADHLNCEVSYEEPCLAPELQADS